MNRGDVVIAVLPGDYGKPRPMVVVQADRLAALASVILCPITSDVSGSLLLRVALEPNPENGLKQRSEIMVEKITAVGRSRCREAIGRLDAATLNELDSKLAFVIGLLA